MDGICEDLSQTLGTKMDIIYSRSFHASANSGDSTASQGNFLIPGASAAVILMLGTLHARRMYEDKKVIEMKEKGIVPEFSPDLKASFLRLLPLRSMSRFWGSLMEVEVPVFMRPTIYRSWARAFHSNLQECALPLEEYPSLQGGPGTMIEQVKGFSYPASSLLGASSSLHDTTEKEISGEKTEQNMLESSNAKSWWRVSVASPKLWDQTQLSPKRGNLFPTNERAMRTIRNLYVEDERVVLEGQWKEGFVAIAAVGATNVGSIKLFIEPELRTNRPGSKILHSQPPDERVYEPEGTGIMVTKGQEIAGFNMGSTVVIMFEAPMSKAREDGSVSSDFLGYQGWRQDQGRSHWPVEQTITNFV